MAYAKSLSQILVLFPGTDIFKQSNSLMEEIPSFPQIRLSHRRTSRCCSLDLSVTERLLEKFRTIH